jgi:hypothetical protein
MTPNLLATATLFTTGRATFRVTPKGRTGDGRRPAVVPRPLRILLGLSVVAGAWYALTLLGVTPVSYAVPWAVHASFGWMLLNVALLWLAIRRVRSPLYAAERRSSVRFATDLPARLDGSAAIVRDVSLTGARLELPGPRDLEAHGRLTVDVPGGRPLDHRGTGRTTWLDAAGRTMLGFEFDEGQIGERARLALALFGSDDADTTGAPTAASLPVKGRRRPATASSAA